MHKDPTVPPHRHRRSAFTVYSYHTPLLRQNKMATKFQLAAIRKWNATRKDAFLCWEATSRHLLFEREKESWKIDLRSEESMKFEFSLSSAEL